MVDPETNIDTRERALQEQLRDQVPRFSRRSLLKGAAGAAGVAVVGSLPLVGCSDDDAPAAVGLGEDRALFERLTEVVLPVQEGSAFVPPSELPVLDHVDAMLKRLDPDLRADLSTGFRLFNWGAVFLGFHFKTFLSLDDEAALAYCRRWEQGNTVQRGLMNAMKSMILVSYWREEATWPAVAYAGPVSAKAGTPHLGNAPLPIEDRPPEPEVGAEESETTTPVEEVSHAG